MLTKLPKKLLFDNVRLLNQLNNNQPTGFDWVWLIFGLVLLDWQCQGLLEWASNWELVSGCLLDHLRYVRIIYEKTKGVTQFPWDLHWENKNIQVKQVKDHISFGGMSMMYRPTSGSTVNQYIGYYVSRYSVDSQPRCQLRVDRESTKYRPTSRLRVVFLSVECRSTDSISSVSAMYRWILGQVLVRYRLTIGIAYSRSICWPCDV